MHKHGSYINITTFVISKENNSSKTFLTTSLGLG